MERRSLYELFVCFWFTRVPDQSLQQRESKETVLFPQGATLTYRGYYLVMDVSIVWNFQKFYVIDKVE